MARIGPPGRDRRLVEDNLAPTQQVTTWAQRVSEGAQTLEGEGSPEGVVEGFIGWDFLDTLNTVFYKKSIEGGTTGWIALN